MTSLKSDKYEVFISKNLDHLVKLKQREYNLWRKNNNQKYKRYFDIMNEGNYKVEYITDDEYKHLKQFN